MERTDSVNLPAEEPRCEPSKPCVVRHRCARGIAALPARFAKLEDYSLGTGGGTVLCLGFLAAEVIRRQVAQPVRPRVHRPMGES